MTEGFWGAPPKEDHFWDATANDDQNPLKRELINMVTMRYAATPRHMQRELGPSEVGHPCMRKMAMAMMEVPRCNPEYDPLPSILGTATHTWLESAARYVNHAMGRTRWLTETRVNVTSDLAGSCDLFDLDTGTVIDWKVLGNISFDKNSKQPSLPYRRQVHLYGQGFINAGLEVRKVAIAMLPRGKTLHNMALWEEDYNQSIVDETLRHRSAVIQLLDDLRPDEHPERYEWFPTQPYDCVWCPFWKPEPRTPLECPGDR